MAISSIDISGLYSAPNEATNAPERTALMFVPVELEDVEDGMTLRLYDLLLKETIVSTVRLEAFGPVDEALVVDAVYPNARLSDVFGGYQVSVLELAY